MTTTSKNGALIFGSATDIPCPFEDTHKCNECNYACSQVDTLRIHMTTVSINVALISLGHSLPCIAGTPNPKIRSTDLFLKVYVSHYKTDPLFTQP